MSAESLQSQEERTPSQTKTACEQTKPGETINSFVTHLKSLAEHCDYGKKENNQVRDIGIFQVTNKKL